MSLDELHRYEGKTIWPNQSFEGGSLDAPSTIKNGDHNHGCSHMID